MHEYFMKKVFSLRFTHSVPGEIVLSKQEIPHLLSHNMKRVNDSFFFPKCKAGLPWWSDG